MPWVPACRIIQFGTSPTDVVDAESSALAVIPAKLDPPNPATANRKGRTVSQIGMVGNLLLLRILIPSPELMTGLID